MTGSDPTTDRDASDVTGTTNVARRTADSRPELRLAVVRYERKPDMGTIHPPALDGVERMDTWISATMSTFVDLEAWR